MHREFSTLYEAWSPGLDADRYGRRSQTELGNARMSDKCGAFVRSRRWQEQVRDFVVGRLTDNINRLVRRTRPVTTDQDIAVGGQIERSPVRVPLSRDSNVDAPATEFVSHVN